ncbi:MAG TPA: D-amino-acid transaminase [bacterium]|nr:D-amino-acid transaminase [bacterium]
MIVYLNGRFLPKKDACISTDDRGFLFGDGTYEVIRIYRGRLFRFDDHLRRLKRSLNGVRILLPPGEDLRAVAERLIRENALSDADAVLYIQITRGVAPRSFRHPEPGTPPTVYVTAYPFSAPAERWETGAKVIFVPDIRWTRCDIKSVSLLANVLAGHTAVDAGADEAVFVRDGVVTEGTHTNFAAFFGGTLQTHPADNLILDGITRDVILELCGKLRIPVREEPVPESAVGNADECLLLGSTTEVMPVIQIDGRVIGNGRPGPLTRKLRESFQKMTRA